MSLAHAAFCVIFFAGIGSIVWFFYELIREYRKAGFRRGWRHWPSGHGRTYFTDYKRSFDDDY